MKALGLCCLLLTFFDTAQGEVVGEREQAFLIKYSDGIAERYIAKYTGNLEVRQWETGKPWTPQHPYDDRQCHWSIGTNVQRQVCQVNRAGEQFCKGQLNRVYGTEFAGKGSGFVATKLHPENCGATGQRVASDVNDAKNALATALRTVPDSDREQVMMDLKVMTRADTVTPSGRASGWADNSPGVRR